MVAERLANNVATAYALSYFLGTLLVVWFLPAIGPRLMRVNLIDACKELERTMGIGAIPASGSTVRRCGEATRLPPSLAGQRWGRWRTCARPRRVTIERLRRGPALVDVTPPCASRLTM